MLPNRGTSPELAIATHTRFAARFCDKHPHGYRGKCGDCANARTAFAAAQAAAAEHDVALEAANDFERRRRQQIIDNCPHRCAENFGRIEVVIDGVETLVPCDHGLPKVVGDG